MFLNLFRCLVSHATSFDSLELAISAAVIGVGVGRGVDVGRGVGEGPGVDVGCGVDVGRGIGVGVSSGPPQDMAPTAKTRAVRAVRKTRTKRVGGEAKSMDRCPLVCGLLWQLATATGDPHGEPCEGARKNAPESVNPHPSILLGYTCMTRPLVAVASASVLLSNEGDKWQKRRLAGALP